MSIEYPNKIVMKQQSKYRYELERPSDYPSPLLNWKFTSQDIEWINKEIGPHDFSLLDPNA